jgi:hypothetical protein
VLAIGSLRNGELLKPLLQGSAFSLNENTLEVSTASFASRLTSLFSGEQARTDIDAASYLSDTSQWRGLLSVRSPWNTGRVVVIATGTDDHQLQQLPDDMTTPRLKAMRTAILWRRGRWRCA